MKKTAQKKQTGIFWYAYAFLCVVLAITIFTVTSLLHDYIEAFENFRPEHTVEEYIKTLTEAEITKLVSPKVAELSSSFNSDSAVSDAVKEMLAENELSIVESVSEGDSPAFDVYCGEKLCTVTLVQCSGGKYGFTNYTVASAEIAEDWVTSRLTTVSVIAPMGCEVILNDWQVDDSYVVGTAEAGKNVTEFERDDSFGYELEIYEIADIFGKAEVRALNENGEIELNSPAEGVYTSDYAAVDSAFTVLAPVGAVVTLNGVTVSDTYITNVVTAPDAKAYETESAPKCAVYTIKGLRNVPTVEVTIDGGELGELIPVTVDGCDVAYTYPEAYKRSYTVHVPEGLTLYCNGVEVDETNIASDDGEYSVPDAVKKYVKTEKTCIEYVIDGLYEEPEFTSSDENCVIDVANGILTFYPAPTEKEMETLYDEALNFTELYIKYSYEGTKYTEANYNAVIEHVKKGSDAYDIIEVSYSSMIYNSNFKVDKLETEIYDMVKYADNCYGVKVDFDSHGTYYKYEKVSVGTYTMIWIVSGGDWQLAYFKFV